MVRDYYVNGESLILVKGRSDSVLASLTQLGLTSDPIRITPNFKHQDINVDAWGQAPADVQWMLAEVNVSMTLIHFDPDVLNTCLALSMGGGQTAPGQMARAGTRMGGGVASTIPGNNYIRLNIASPGAARPWRFFSSYLTGPPMTFPLGTEKSMVAVNWRVVPYTTDPAGIVGGVIFGATNFPLYDFTLDT